MKFLIPFAIVLTLTLPGGCKKGTKSENVDIDQIEIDGSSNNRYIFRKEINREKWKEKRYKKEDF